MSKSEKQDNKVKDLAKFREDSAGGYLTSNQGLPITAGKEDSNPLSLLASNAIN